MTSAHVFEDVTHATALPFNTLTLTCEGHNGQGKCNVYSLLLTAETPSGCFLSHSHRVFTAIPAMRFDLSSQHAQTEECSKAQAALRLSDFSLQSEASFLWPCIRTVPYAALLMHKNAEPSALWHSVAPSFARKPLLRFEGLLIAASM